MDKKRPNDSQFAKMWVSAYKRGLSITEFSEESGINLHTAHSRHRRLCAVGVNLPKLSGQRSLKSEAWEKILKLNELVARELVK